LKKRSEISQQTYGNRIQKEKEKGTARSGIGGEGTIGGFFCARESKKEEEEAEFLPRTEGLN